MNEPGTGGRTPDDVARQLARNDRLGRIGAGLTLVGAAVLIGVDALQGHLGGFAFVIGGLALNALIVGPALFARRWIPRLRKWLPGWLGW
ncbi:MAG TPA: hypothetical protein VNF73_03485 [Candidatus Saccharimonadales bacterium]|nr:hypothetical protein [Candidatus Saccharimonadales bacterium]